MVAKIISGRNIKGALNYNELKVKQGFAACIDASHFGCEAHEMNFKDKLKLFSNLISLNKRTKTNTLHISLNFDVSENLDTDKLKMIASLYMNKIGFGDQPYLVYQHFDAGHPHIHIVTTNIQEGGRRISIHNLGRNQSEKARKEIEKEFGLVEAEGKTKIESEFIQPVDVQKAIYGKSETKRSISNIVRMVARSYKFTSLPEFNAVLSQYNVIADRGKEGTLMHTKRGLVYSLLDGNGTKVGVPIKASSIYTKPTLPFIEKQFALNEMLRQPFKASVKDALDKALSNPLCCSQDDLAHILSKVGIHTSFHQSATGMVYGLTLVDNQRKVVFNGSDLGKAYSAKSILDRIAVNTILTKMIVKKQDYNLTSSANTVTTKADVNAEHTRAGSSVNSKNERVPKTPPIANEKNPVKAMSNSPEPRPLPERSKGHRIEHSTPKSNDKSGPSSIIKDLITAGGAKYISPEAALGLKKKKKRKKRRL